MENEVIVQTDKPIDKDLQEASKRYQRNVSIKQCIITIVASLIALCVLFIPLSFNGGPMAIKTMPIFGDGSYLELQKYIAGGFGALANFNDSAVSTVGTILNLSIYAYIGILLCDILFAIILIATKSVIARIIFKVFSIIFAVAFVGIVMIQLLHILGYIGWTLHDITSEVKMCPPVDAFVFAIAVMAVSVVMVNRQKNWFSRWY
ncbi:MAG: hypothetical protein IJC07_05920 [Clostridia bacterium]|nr:hypothetical protein [Clostridia bacterium]